MLIRGTGFRQSGMLAFMWSVSHSGDSENVSPSRARRPTDSGTRKQNLSTFVESFFSLLLPVDVGPIKSGMRLLQFTGGSVLRPDDLRRIRQSSSSVFVPSKSSSWG